MGPDGAGFALSWESSVAEVRDLKPLQVQRL